MVEVHQAKESTEESYIQITGEVSLPPVAEPYRNRDVLLCSKDRDTRLPAFALEIAKLSRQETCLSCGRGLSNTSQKHQVARIHGSILSLEDFGKFTRGELKAYPGVGDKKLNRFISFLTKHGVKLSA